MAEHTIQRAFELALQHHQAGRLREAEQLYRQILAREPNHTDALHCLGVAADQLGRNDIAVELIRRAIALKPDFPAAHSNLGNALKHGGRLDEAIAACRQAVALNPNFPEGHNNLGNALNQKESKGTARRGDRRHSPGHCLEAQLSRSLVQSCRCPE
jgi:protein O-GlcNAc transferase